MSSLPLFPDPDLNPESMSSTAGMQQLDGNEAKQTMAHGAVKRYSFDSEQPDPKKKPVNSPMARKDLQKVEDEQKKLDYALQQFCTEWIMDH